MLPQMLMQMPLRSDEGYVEIKLKRIQFFRR